MKRTILPILIAVLSLIALRQTLFRSRANKVPSADSASNISPAPVQRSRNIDVPSTDLPEIPTANLTSVDRDKIGRIVTVFSAPISFFGKVLDQYGEPIPDAKIHYSAADQYFGSGSKYEGVSDVNGRFSISGIKGAGLYVSVYKGGYQETEASGGSFGYGMPSGRQPPSKEEPAVFVLRKKGPTEPLVVVSSRQYEVPKTGEPVAVNLRTGRKARTDRGDIQVESWVDEQSKDQLNHFDWKCRVSVPGGGLMERNDPLVFEAPEDGYIPSVDIVMPQSAKQWKPRVEKDYFVRLADNNYAHLKLEMHAGGSYNFFVLESYLNLAGSRNLESDPNKAIRAH